VGASRATRGRLASTQGCHRCPCPSRWARPLALRAWWRWPLLLPARQHTGGGTDPGNKGNAPPQPSPKKENTGEACGGPLPPLPGRLPVLLLLAAVRLLLRSCGVSLLPLPCAGRCRACAVAGCCLAVRRVAAAVAVRLPGAALPLRAPQPAAVLPRRLSLALRAFALAATVGCRFRPCPAAAVGCRVLPLQHTGGNGSNGFPQTSPGRSLV
jgi:hypothetical protein